MFSRVISVFCLLLVTFQYVSPQEECPRDDVSKALADAMRKELDFDDLLEEMRTLKVAVKEELHTLQAEWEEVKSQLKHDKHEVSIDMSNFGEDATEAKPSIEMFRANVTKLLNDVASKVSGSSYIRWGRTACPENESSLVYSGYMVGSFYNRYGEGDGANYLCLPENPTWDHTVDSMDNFIRVTGVEYKFYPFHRSTTQFFGSEIGGSRASCAMCHISRGTNIMVPGRTDCFPDWTMEYRGYLVTGYPGYDDASEYVCLDRRAESVPNSGQWKGNNVMYFVEADCESGLECPPYGNGRELACVVCSR